MNFISPNLIQYPNLLDSESIQKSSTTYAQTVNHSEHKIASNNDFKTCFQDMDWAFNFNKDNQKTNEEPQAKTYHWLNSIWHWNAFYFFTPKNKTNLARLRQEIRGTI